MGDERGNDLILVNIIRNLLANKSGLVLCIHHEMYCVTLQIKDVLLHLCQKVLLDGSKSRRYFSLYAIHYFVKV